MKELQHEAQTPQQGGEARRGEDEGPKRRQLRELYPENQRVFFF